MPNISQLFSGIPCVRHFVYHLRKKEVPSAMNWLISLRDQMPLLLVLSPLIGFVVTFVASRFEPDLIRPLAISNAACTLLILGGLEWRFESDLAIEAAIVSENSESASINEVRRTFDRQRVERLTHQWFAVDGINLFPAMLIVGLTAVAVWRMDFKDSSFYPCTMLFEAASLAVLTACDIRIFVMSFTASAVTMSLMIAVWGNSERRNLASRFLFSQVCGGALTTLGFSMLVLAVPWMKMQDTAAQPTLTWNIAALTQDIQKLTTRNELAFHYENEVFPWMLLVLSLGFAIQAGLFPFHSPQIGVIRNSRPTIAALYIAGYLSANCVGWFRFVMPLAPDLLASFDWLLLIPSFGGAVWGSLRALVAHDRRERIAFLIMSLLGIALLGCYCFTRIGISGTWLMQQQIAAIFCAVLLIEEQWINAGNQSENQRSRFREYRSSTRTTLLMLCVPILGLFASGFAIMSELQRENLLVAFGLFIVYLIIFGAMYLEFDRGTAGPKELVAQSNESGLSLNPSIVVGLIAVIVNLVPNLPLHQCEPEFARTFRRFERSLSAISATNSAAQWQSKPNLD